jgi:hypothetical protein
MRTDRFFPSSARSDSRQTTRVVFPFASRRSLPDPSRAGIAAPAFDASYDFRRISSEIVFRSRGNPPFTGRVSAQFRFRGSRSDLAETASRERFSEIEASRRLMFA